jgi:hypothetical protein
MAKRRPITREMPDAVREAVDRTVQATIGSAQLTRGRAQEAVDELVRTAGSSAGAVRERVIGVYEDRRPVTNEDLNEIRTELRKISRRLGAIERRLENGDEKSDTSGGGRSARGGSSSGGARGSKGTRGSSGSRGTKGSRGGSSSGSAASGPRTTRRSSGSGGSSAGPSA